MRRPSETKQRRLRLRPRRVTVVTGWRWPAISPGWNITPGSWRKISRPSAISSVTVPPSQDGGAGSWLPVIHIQSAARPSAASAARSPASRRSAASRSWNESPSATIRLGRRRVTTSPMRLSVVRVS